MLFNTVALHVTATVFFKLTLNFLSVHIRFHTKPFRLCLNTIYWTS